MNESRRIFTNNWSLENMLCYVMLCYVMLCYVMLCYVMLWFSKRNHRAMLNHNTSGKLRWAVARILKLHGTWDGNVSNLLFPQWK